MKEEDGYPSSYHSYHPSTIHEAFTRTPSTQPCDIRHVDTLDTDSALVLRPAVQHRTSSVLPWIMVLAVIFVILVQGVSAHSDRTCTHHHPKDHEVEYVKKFVLGVKEALPIFI